MSQMKYGLHAFVCIWMICLLFGYSAGALRAAESVDINVNADGFAVNGYDAVSYFDAQGPVMGSDKYVHSYKGAKYSFSSGKNLRQFQESPEKYVPAYGGYCAYGVVLGKKFDVAPDAWRIVNNVLFFQLDKGTKLIWEENLEKNIAIGDRTWPRIAHVPANDL